MDQERRFASSPLIAVALFAALLAAYVSGYVVRSKVGMLGPNRVRTFPSQFEANLFGPFAFVESLYQGREVYVAHEP